MKKLLLFVLLFLSFSFILLAAAQEGLSVAAATESVEIVSVKAKDGDGNYTDYTYEDGFGRDILITALSEEYRLSFTVMVTYDNLNYTKIAEYIEVVPQNKKTEFKLTDNGVLKIIIQGQDMFGTPKGKEASLRIRSDNAAPSAPEFDADIFEVYRTSPFNIEYTLNRDVLSGIDFQKSKYGYYGFDNVTVAEGLFEADNYSQKFISGIDRNGKLVFDLYDKAGNRSEYTYYYTKYGVNESDAPLITVTPKSKDGYAKKVDVSISWGADYDQNPLTVKEYDIIYANKSEKHNYTDTGAFFIDTEGVVTVRAYYYKDGQKLFIDEVIDNVDKTPPDQNTMSDITVYCDIMSANPVYIRVRAFDHLSGIKKLYLSTGEEFRLVTGGVYEVGITGMKTIMIIAEDYAGNIQTYMHGFPDYDFQGMTEYHDKFMTLDSDDYCADGWIDVLSSYQKLSSYMITERAESGQIYQLKKNIDRAIEGAVTFTERIVDMPIGLTTIKLTVDGEAVALKKGTVATTLIDRVFLTAKELEKKYNALSVISGLNSPSYYNFNLKLQDQGAADIAVLSEIEVGVCLPSKAGRAKLYLDTADGLIELESEIRDRYIFAKTDVLGDFYLVTEETEDAGGLVIGGRLYSWAIVGVMIGIISVFVIGSVITIVVLRKKG